MLRLLIFLTLFLLLPFLYAEIEPGANEMCPVMPEEEIDPEIFTEYQGKKVYLCCKKCLRKFTQNPEAYAANLASSSEIEPLEKSHSSSSSEVENDDKSHEENLKGSHLLRFAGKFHPVSVHFPIALILTAAFIELLAWRTRKSFFRDSARLLVFLASLGTIFAVALGWAAGAFASYPGELESVLSIHRWLGTSTGVLIVFTSIFSELYHRKEQNKYQAIYRTALFISAILVMITGHLGGTLIYGVDYFSW